MKGKFKKSTIHAIINSLQWNQLIEQNLLLQPYISQTCRPNGMQIIIRL